MHSALRWVTLTVLLVTLTAMPLSQKVTIRDDSAIKHGPT